MFLTILPRLVNRVSRPSKRGRRRAPRSKACAGRLWLEPLEERILLDAIRWTNPAGGDWGVAGNWDLNRLPAAGDDVLINIAVTGPVTHSQGVTDSIQSLNTTDPFVLSRGTVNVVSTLSSTSTFTLAGGTLASATVGAGTTITATGSGGTLAG